MPIESLLPGPYAVGLSHRDVVPNVTAGQPDNIGTVASCFYPATPSESAESAYFADLFRGRAAAAILAAAGPGREAEARVAARVVSSLALRCRRDASPAVGDSPFPILIYTPGGCAHRFGNVAVCEDLASLGYVVYALDAPRDAPAVVFGDGRIVTGPMDPDEDYIWPRVEYVRTLVQLFPEINRHGPLQGLLDIAKIGLFGSSRGGYVSVISAFALPEVTAAVNMDGFPWGFWCEGTGLTKHPAEFQERVRGTRKPILRLVGDRKGEDEARAVFARESADFAGDFTLVSLNGWSHGDFGTTPWVCGDPVGLPESAEDCRASAERTGVLVALLDSFFGECLGTGRARAEGFDGIDSGRGFVFSKRCEAVTPTT